MTFRKHEFVYGRDGVGTSSRLRGRAEVVTPSRSRTFLWFKGAFDVLVGVVLLVATIIVALFLLVLNPFFNPGPLFFVQARMGRDCRAFPAFKFRTMKPAERIYRRADDPLEMDRITGLGSFLRKTRLDELPQAINVLRGEMSVIGPRPDYFHHARRYIQRVPGYRERHRMRPGITGLAQTELGYANGVDATRAKVRADLHYVENASVGLDLYIAFRTAVTMLTRAGS